MMVACCLPLSRALLRSALKLNVAVSRYELHLRSGRQYSSAAMSGFSVKQWRPKVKAESLSGADPNPAWDQLTTVVETLSKEVPSNADKVSISLKVSETVVQLIKRKRGKMKRKIELDTKTTLSISKGKAGGVVGVQGLSKESVDDAAAKIRVLIDEAEADSTSKQLPSTVASSQVSKGLGPLQWKPKAGLHTAAGESESSEVNELDEEEVSGSIQIDKKLLRLVKGRNDEVKKRIEKETRTKIIIASPIVVKGESEESVQKALEEIQKVVEEGVNDSKFQYSHFISLPLNIHPALVKQLEEFQKSILTSLGLPFEDEPEAAAQAPTDPESGDTVDEEIKAAEATLHPEPEARVETVGDQMDVEDNLDVQTVVDAAFRESVAHSLGVEMDVANAKERCDPPLEPADTSSTVEEADKAEPGKAAEETVPAQQDSCIEEKAVEVTVPVKPRYEETCSHVKPGEEKSSEEAKYEPLKEVAMTAKKECKTGIEMSIFIKPSRFHLTILMLKLWNEERVQKASEVLQKCLPEIAAVLEGRPLMVSLRGLEIMKGSPKNTRVLYAKVAEVGEGDRLLKACKVLIDAFVESGLVLGKDREESLKLHATVMNTSHRKSKSKFKNRGFDATQIIEKYGDVNWGEYEILEAHLSQRFAYDENGYYHCCSSILFTSEPAAKQQSDDKKVEEEAAKEM